MSRSMLRKWAQNILFHQPQRSSQKQDARDQGYEVLRYVARESKDRFHNIHRNIFQDHSGLKHPIVNVQHTACIDPQWRRGQWLSDMDPFSRHNRR